MEKINFKQPKYILPLLALPFFCLFFYVYRSSTEVKKVETKQQEGFNTNVGSVSAEVRKKNLSDKLDAYRNTFKEADGLTAVNPIAPDTGAAAGYSNVNAGNQQRMLDSIDRVLKRRYAEQSIPQVPLSGVLPKDRALADALAGLSKRRGPKIAEQESVPQHADPMATFKQQMAYMDSLAKENDPEYKAAKQQQAALDRAEAERKNQVTLAVHKPDDHFGEFNTIRPQRRETFILACIDENLTGYAGSRIRLRLLEDIKAGNTLVKKGAELYATINGFSSQRVTFEISTILYDNKILPVKLDLYDLDGLPGLYVPESAFRDFTKNLGGNSIQGVNIDGSSGTGSQLLMSSVDRIFQSTSTAIAEAIRKNKAKIKYNSYIYLIDNEALQSAQKNY